MMRDQAQAYVDSVLEHVRADTHTRARLREDLLSHIEAAAAQESMDAVLRRMGQPSTLAAELDEYMETDGPSLFAQLEQTRAAMQSMQAYEYRSKATFLGVPLVHIHMRRAQGTRPCVARGILAIGDVAIGLFALGGVAIGGIALGGVAMGLLLAFDGLALGGFALGGLAVGFFALGGGAIGVYAMGGAAIAVRVATGGYASAAVALGENTVQTAQLTLEEATARILAAYPNTESWLLRLLTMPFR